MLKYSIQLINKSKLRNWTKTIIENSSYTSARIFLKYR